MHAIWFSSILTRKATIVTSCLLSCTPTTDWKGVYSKRKEFAPVGANYFLFRVDPFSVGDNIKLIELPPLNSIHFSEETAGDVREIAFFHYHSWIGSFKLSLIVSIFSLKMIHISYSDHLQCLDVWHLHIQMIQYWYEKKVLQYHIGMSAVSPEPFAIYSHIVEALWKLRIKQNKHVCSPNMELRMRIKEPQTRKP